MPQPQPTKPSGYGSLTEFFGFTTFQRFNQTLFFSSSAVDMNKMPHSHCRCSAALSSAQHCSRFGEVALIWRELVAVYLDCWIFILKKQKRWVWAWNLWILKMDFLESSLVEEACTVQLILQEVQGKIKPTISKDFQFKRMQSSASTFHLQFDNAPPIWLTWSESHSALSTWGLFFK